MNPFWHFQDQSLDIMKISRHFIWSHITLFLNHIYITYDVFKTEKSKLKYQKQVRNSKHLDTIDQMQSDSSKITDYERKQEEKQIVNYPTAFYHIVNCTYQTFLGYLCLDACVTISLSFVSKYVSKVADSGLGLAYSSINLLVIPVAFGINQSLNIHTSQALGTGKTRLAKSYLPLNFLLIFLAMTPLCLVLFALKYPISLTIAESDRTQTADAAWEFLRYMMPSMILSMEFESLKTFMVAHKVVYPFTFIHIATTGFHFFFSWLFVAEFDWGIPGAGFAMILTEILNFVGLLIFALASKSLRVIVFKGVSLNWNTIKSLTPSYLKTSSPIIIHIYSEFFVFFLLGFVALSLGTDVTNANLGIQNTIGICFRLPISLQLALMAFVGTEMGKTNIINAKRYTISGILLFTITTSIIILALTIFPDVWANIFTDDQNVKDLLLETLPWMNFGVIFIDGFQGTINGALKGIEKQKLVTYTTLISYYVFCIPLVFCLTYSWGVGLGLKGIWIAFGIANAIQLVLYSVVLVQTNWETQSIEISKRVQKQNECGQGQSQKVSQIDNYDN